MNYLLGIALLSAVVCVVAYRLGSRSALWGFVLAPLLLRFAWWAFVEFDFHLGDGAPSGAAVLPATIWFAGGMSVLVAGILLGASFYRRRTLIGGGALFLVFLPVVAMLVMRGSTRKHPGSQLPVQQQAQAEPHLNANEGYIWAMDRGVASEAECTVGTPDFVAGCKRAVQRHSGRD